MKKKRMHPILMGGLTLGLILSAAASSHDQTHAHEGSVQTFLHAPNRIGG